ncbi:hypothetical protein Pssp01_14340 [Pseudomonas sp. NBRC 100443]|nr:hypothetical protein Pssp01_14340 [Pseudomonas sp. NBRC 100443]
MRAAILEGAYLARGVAEQDYFMLAAAYRQGLFPAHFLTQRQCPPVGGRPSEGRRNAHVDLSDALRAFVVLAETRSKFDSCQINLAALGSSEPDPRTGYLFR